MHLTNRDLPVLITSAGKPLRRPSLREVAREVGLLRPLAREDEKEIHCDLAIIGAGPAGLAAAVYATSEALQRVVLESHAPGGQAGSSSLIENFFGFPTGISGGALTWLAQLQAYRFGAKFSTPSQALSLDYHPEREYRADLYIEGCDAVLHAKCALIATGAQYQRLAAEAASDSKVWEFITPPLRLKVSFAATRRCLLSAGRIRPGRRRCLFLKALPGSC